MNALPAAAVAERLAAATTTKFHAFWADSISLLDGERIAWSKALGARALTDAYLLALAVANKGRFVTLDRAVPLTTVVGAKARHLVVL